MSLRMLFDPTTLSGLMGDWPTKPAVYELPADSQLPLIINAEVLDQYIDSGAMPADQVIVIKAGAALHPRAYTTAGRLDPAKLAKWRGRGYSLQLRNINHWCPPLNAMCSAIQRETGSGCHVTGFVTPPGGQGLNHHWDQNMGLIYQVAGRKTWQVWESVVEEPHRDHLASNARPGTDLVDRLRAAAPDREFDLGPGRLAGDRVPSGHSPARRRCRGGDQPHLRCRRDRPRTNLAGAGRAVPLGSRRLHHADHGDARQRPATAIINARMRGRGVTADPGPIHCG